MEQFLQEHDIDIQRKKIRTHRATGALGPKYREAAAIQLLLREKFMIDPSSEEIAGVIKENGERIAIFLKEKRDEIRNLLEKAELVHDAQLDQIAEIATNLRSEITYPDQTDIEAETQEAYATADTARMTVTPMHGTCTFKIDPLMCETLRQNQVSLDDTQWQKSLGQFGWNLVRPPRIRVFYSNDILYIGAEIPHTMMSMADKKQYETMITNYTRTIGELVFPQIKKQIHDLPVNEHLRSRFLTARGQRGQVLSIDRQFKDGQMVHDVTTFYHGDSRYLPHYQTGSGFITAFLENELFANVYQHKDIDSLLTWLYTQPNVPKDKPFTKKEIIEKFTADLPPDMDEEEKEEYALEAFQAEVFKQLSLEIIEKNQEKVGRYLNAINTQTLHMLGTNIDEMLSQFNQLLKVNVKHTDFPKNTDPRMIAISLLQNGNLSFLREYMPKVLNVDFSKIHDDKLFQLRDMFVKDMKHSLMLERMPKKDDPHDEDTNYIDLDRDPNMHKAMAEVERDLSAANVQIAMIKAIFDYTKGGVLGRIAAGAWNRTEANLVRADKVIQGVERGDYRDIDALKVEIQSLKLATRGEVGAFKKALEQIKPDDDDPQQGVTHSVQ